MQRLEILEETLSGSVSYTGNARWMIPYADLLTILLGLFLVLLSLSTLDNRFPQTQTNTQRMDTALGADPQVLERQARELEALRKKLIRLSTLSGSLQRVVPADEASKTSAKTLPGLQITRQPRGLVITLLDSLLFDSGSAELSPGAQITLDHLADVLKETAPHPIRVEGHTDDSPIATSQYPSNWELSTARATHIVRYLVEVHGFDPDRLSAAGYGEYHPAGENSSIQGKQKNRRVDIVILNQDAARLEPENDPRPNLPRGDREREP